MAADRTPPAFPEPGSVEEERRHRKQRLAAALRVFGQFGFDEGAAGHITARDPERPDHFWVNPLGMNFKQVRVRDLLLVDDRGEVVHGDWPLNKAAFAIHSQIHAARPDVVAAAHSHSVHGKAWSSLHRTLDPLTQDACAFYGDHVLVEDYTGVVLDPEEGKRIAHTLGDHKAAILANHGLLTVGRTIAEAFVWMYRAERACRMQLAVQQSGAAPVEIPAEVQEVTIARNRKANGPEGHRPIGKHEWPALLRKLDRVDTSYRD